MRFPEKFTSIEKGILISIESIKDCSIKLSNGKIIKGRFVGKQRMFLNEIAKINKEYFIAIYNDSGVSKGRILTKFDFKYDDDINNAIRNIPNYQEILN